MCKSNNDQHIPKLRPEKDTFWHFVRPLGFTVTPLHNTDHVVYIGYGCLGNLCAMDSNGQIIPVGSFYKDYSALYRDLCMTLMLMYMQYQHHEVITANPFCLGESDKAEYAYDAWELVTDYLSDQVTMGINATLDLLHLLETLCSEANEQPDEDEQSDEIPQKDESASPKPIHGFLSMPCLPLEKGSPFPIGICLTLAGEEEESQDS